MAKTILLYSAIYTDTAAKFIQDLDANRGSDVRVAVNCPGGDPYATYGMIAMANGMDNVCYDVHGQASSCAFYLLAGSPNKAENTGLNVSSYVAHRAASWMEKYPEMYTDAVKAELEAVNGNLRALIENGIGADKFKSVTGKSLDEVFDMSKRLDVVINGRQAQKLGIIGKVIPLSTKLKAEIESNANKYHIAAFAQGTSFSNLESSNDTNMDKEIKTLAELKAAYPALVLQAETEATTAAIESEKIRVEAWSVWAPYDAEAVAAGIASGKLPTAADTAKFQVKAMSPDILKKMQAANKNVVTPDTDASKTEAEARLKAFLAEVDEDDEDEELKPKGKKKKKEDDDDADDE